MGTPYILRPYQQNAVDASVRFLKGKTKGNGIIVAPTGCGKSLIIANIVKELNAPTLIFQPSKEILEQNYEKLLSYGYNASIYSASMKQKEVSDITFATIGSVVSGHCGRVFPEECGYDVTKTPELWQPNTDYEIGDRVKKSVKSQLPFRCFKAGKSGENVPDLIKGSTVKDGSVSWICDDDCEQSASICQKLGQRDKFMDVLDQFKYILIDECHLVNAKASDTMYNSFIKKVGGKCLGLTATPYRLASNSWGSELRFLTRTRPKIFDEVVYYVQNKALFDAGYLAPLHYMRVMGINRAKLQPNSTGADFSDGSVRAQTKTANYLDCLTLWTKKMMSERKNVLVFTRFVEEAQELVNRIPGSAIVTAETPAKERVEIINGFKSGRIKVVANVGILQVGFDYPELETVIIARPTMSLALWYQMIGRGIRPHKDKDKCVVVDLAGNYDTFGAVESLELCNAGNGKWFVSNQGKQLTNVYFGERR